MHVIRPTVTGFVDIQDGKTTEGSTEIILDNEDVGGVIRMTDVGVGDMGDV
jgi:hypothetical protein